MTVYTQSSMRTWHKCHRLYQLSYIDLIRPVDMVEPIKFGALWHEVREAYWNGFSTAASVMRIIRAKEDPFFAVRIEAMLSGYAARWGAFIAGLRILGVEQKFSYELDGHLVHGKFDAVVREGGELWVVEEKTAKGDLELDSPYWRRLEIDPQCSIYFDAAERMYDQRPAGIMYFVNVKPALRPKKKAENVRIKKDGAPCAGQQLVDETPAEFQDRLLAAIAEEPERYYHMVRVPRLAADIEASRADVADTIADIESARRYTRNNDACIHPFGGACSFLPVCAGRASVDDIMLYRRAKTAHEEL